MARIVLNTFGSFGDLHPYLAIAIELRRRGHDPVIATSEIYSKKITAEGVDFAVVRPDVGSLLDDPAFLARGHSFFLRGLSSSYACTIRCTSG